MRATAMRATTTPENESSSRHLFVSNKCADVCKYKQDGHPLHYYDDCGGSDNAYIYYKEKKENWCYEENFGHDICCGGVDECCELRRDVVGATIGGGIGLLILLCLLCCLLSYCCCGRVRHVYRPNPPPESKEQKEQQTDDEEGGQ